jgi:hypothetical protein
MAITWSQEEVANTISRYSPQVIDNISNHSPLLYMLKENGNMTTTGGGTTLGHEIHLAENSSGKFYSGYEQLNTNSNPVMRRAEFDWKQYNINILFSGEERRINSSKEAKHKLIKERIKNAEITMANDIAASLFSDGTGTSGKEIGGLQLLVADDPTTGTMGTIDRSVETKWRNQLYDFSVESVTPGADTIVAAMDKLWRRCTFGNQTPDLIVAGDTYFGYYESAVGALKAINVNANAMTRALGDAGFTVLQYKNTPVVYDSNCNDERMYMLNMKHMFFEVHPDANFSMGDRKPAFDQDVWLIPLIFMGNMTTDGARYHGVMIA